MIPGIIYRLQWSTVPVVLPAVAQGGLGDIITSEEITVDIEDTETLIPDDQDPQIVTLEKAFSPLVISTINNDEDKFVPAIRAKQAKISFLSDQSQGHTAALFANASSKRYKVTVSTETQTVFIGFLVGPDIQQPFLPDPVTVSLTAIDQLGMLKGSALLGFDGLNPQGKYRFADTIAMALYPTGLALDINVIMNVRHGSGTLVSTPGAIFQASNKTITLGSTQYFYVGQEIAITGTASNDGTYNITDIGQGILTIIQVQQAVVNETIGTPVTFTDISSDGHLYDKLYEDAKTWEANIGESEDCYTVLEKILGEDCVLFQYKGAWWIFRLDEIDENLLYPFKFNADGSLDGAMSTINPTRPIGNNSDIVHANASTLLRFGQGNKFIKETYKYVPPKEMVCNMDFSRGAATVAPDPTLGESDGQYILECWSIRKTSGSVTSDAFIRRKFNFGVEIEKYVVITPQSSGATPYDFIESQPIELVRSDKGNVSVSFKFKDDITGSGFYTYFLMKIYLRGDDDNWYYWWSTDDLDDPKTYRWTISSVETDRAIASTWNLGDVREGEWVDSNGKTQPGDWQLISVDLAPLPVNGKLYIGLYQGRQGGDSSDNQDIYYQGLNFTYQPFINGSYQLFKGHYNKVTRLTTPGSYNLTRDKEVSIGDSPRKEFKGAMFFIDSNGNSQLTQGKFYTSNTTALAPPADTTYLHPFGYIQAFSVWNQYRNTLSVFNATMLGLFGNAVRDWPDLINKFQLSDENDSSSFRYFILISFEQDWKTMKWTGTLIEVYHQQIGHRYDDTHEFKYTV